MNGLDYGPGFAQAYIDPTFTGYGGVPEPGGWALMLAGFGLAGLALRGRVKGARAAMQ